MKVITARGKTLDMAALIARSPNTPAVGNASMNARGDIISARGQVIKPREQIAMEYHASNPRSVKAVGIKSLSGEMFVTPAEAIATARTQSQPPPHPQSYGQPQMAAQAATARGAPGPRQAEEAPARRRKLVDPDEQPDGGI